jgi:predicted anti-sigma-YlaC factor YlaD
MRRRVAFVLLIAAATAGCSIKRVAIGSLAETLSGIGEVFAADDDPELIRDAVPFALKTIETLLAEVPRHRGLLLQACSGFAQYAYAFVQVDAELVEPTDYDAAKRLRERARRLYLRGRDYCLRSLEAGQPGLRRRLIERPAEALGFAKAPEVPLLYWTGASWGGAIALGLDRPDLVADLPVVRALLERALALDETYGGGALHELFIALEAVPEAMGGSPARAREHFRRAVELSEGRSAGAYVALATGVALPAQDRAEFVRLLEQALAIDPDTAPRLRLANLVAQKRARFYLERVDELILGSSAGRRAGRRMGPPGMVLRLGG